MFREKPVPVPLHYNGIEPGPLQEPAAFKNAITIAIPYKNIAQTRFRLILSRFNGATIDGAWIGEWIYGLLMHITWNY
jgi:hypothetical protein